jgi:hypothetical protein
MPVLLCFPFISDGALLAVANLPTCIIEVKNIRLHMWFMDAFFHDALICLTERFHGLIYFSSGEEKFNRSGIAKVDLSGRSFVYISLIDFKFSHMRATTR